MIFDTILFDLDDTLHNRNRSVHNFIDLFMSRYRNVLECNDKLAIEDTFFKIDNRGNTPRETVFKELLNRFSWKYKPDLNEMIDFWNVNFPNCAEPMPGVYNVLDYFMNKNIKMGIVTNGNSNFQNTKINKLNFRKYMKVIIISEEVNVRKPNPEIFHIALSKINSNSKTTLFVGDNPLIDIKGAIDSGLIPVWINHGQAWNIKQYKPRYSISEISEIIEI